MLKEIILLLAIANIWALSEQLKNKKASFENDFNTFISTKNLGLDVIKANKEKMEEIFDEV